jgi:WD40 repeat protein
MAPDGKRLAAAGEDAGIQLWDLPKGDRGSRLLGHTDWIIALTFSSDGKHLASAGYDGTVRLWEPATRRMIFEIPAKPGVPILSLALNQDYTMLAVGGGDGQISLVNPVDGKPMRSLMEHTGAVTALAFHPGGGLLASGAKDNTVRLWNPANGQMLKSLEGHQAWVQGLAFIAQGTRLASVAADQTVHLWDLR